MDAALLKNLQKNLIERNKLPETKKDGKTDVKPTEPRNLTVKTQLANVKLELEQYKAVVGDLNSEVADLKRQLKESTDTIISDLTPELDLKLTELSGGKLDAIFLNSKTVEEKQQLVQMMSMVKGAEKKTPPFRSIRGAAGPVEVSKGPLDDLYLKTEKDIRKMSVED